jgi:hypothetical protein
VERRIAMSKERNRREEKKYKRKRSRKDERAEGNCWIGEERNWKG